MPHKARHFEQPLMQYTGLKDKNGKEIYEGDIVKGVVKKVQLLTGDTDETYNNDMTGVVVYCYDRFHLECKQTQHLCDKDRDGMCNYFYFHDDYDGDFDDKEVIGNVYENPELLT